MSSSEQRRLIETRMDTQWAISPYAGVPVAYQNQRFTPPDTAWVRLRVANATTLHPEVSARVSRTFGIVFVSVFVPPGSGNGESDRMADTIAGFFRGQRFGGLVFAAPNVVSVGEQRAGMHHQVDVEMPFEFDYHH